MKSFYESNRETSELLITSPEAFFNLHYHANVEIYLITNGEYLMQLNDQTFKISDGSIVVADSYDVHGYTSISPQTVDDCSKILVIPYEYLSYFNKIKGDRKIKNPHLSDKKLCEKLTKFVAEHLETATRLEIKKHAVDYFFSLFLHLIEFEEKTGIDSVKLIKKILTYIHQNFKENISRNSIAKSLGYSEEHISRVFHKFLKTGISNYVNNLRLDYVENNKGVGDKTLLELILEAGFNSQRTYYRVKSTNKKTLR